jgi:hypothetical protein
LTIRSPSAPATTRRSSGCYASINSDEVFGVVSSLSETAFELFLERERAEAFIAEVEDDEPETAALLRVELVELALVISRSG